MNVREKEVKKYIIQAFMLIAFFQASAKDVCITEIRITGARQTKEFTILRELPFRTGDVLTEEQLKTQLTIASNHLNNTGLFNFVYVNSSPDIVTATPDYCYGRIVYINVEERWYWWPQVSLKLEDRNLSNWLHDRNFDRITIGWGLRVYNVFGMRHKFTISDYFGFEKGVRLAYSGIALDHERTKMLGFSFAALYNRTTDVASEHDRVVYLKSSDSFLDRTVSADVSYTYRPGIRSVHAFYLAWQQTHAGDTVLRYNPDYWGTQRRENNAFRFTYDYTFEHRDYAAYPTDGYFVGASFSALTADRMRFYFSELNLRLQYYGSFSKRWFWGTRLNSGISFKNKAAYIYDRYVGYEEKMLAGYDYYVVDGQHYALLNNDLRYCIMPKRVFTLGGGQSSAKFTKIHFTLYARLSLDMGYVHNSNRLPTNTLANTFLWGSGLSLDLLTYYDIIINATYAINRMYERAFYFGLKAPLF